MSNHKERLLDFKPSLGQAESTFGKNVPLNLVGARIDHWAARFQHAASPGAVFDRQFTDRSASRGLVRSSRFVNSVQRRLLVIDKP